MRIGLPHEVFHVSSHLLGCFILEDFHNPDLLPSELLDLKT